MEHCVSGASLSRGIPARWGSGAKKRIKKAVRLVRNLLQASGARGLKIEFADRIDGIGASAARAQRSVEEAQCREVYDLYHNADGTAVTCA